MLDQKHELEAELQRPGAAAAGCAAASARGRARAAPSAPRAAGRRATCADEVTDALARLADLRDRGAISPEEYEAKKAELLGRL